MYHNASRTYLDVQWIQINYRGKVIDRLVRLVRAE